MSFSLATGLKFTMREVDLVIGFATPHGVISEMNGPFVLINGTVWVANIIPNSTNLILGQTSFKE